MYHTLIKNGKNPPPQKRLGVTRWLLLNSTECLTEKFTQVVLQKNTPPTLQSPCEAKKESIQTAATTLGTWDAYKKDVYMF